MMTGVVRSHVVTGAGRGVGRAIAERLLSDGDAVVVLERDPDGVAWVAGHRAGPRVVAVTGSADDPATATSANNPTECPETYPTGACSPEGITCAYVTAGTTKRVKCLVEGHDGGSSSPRWWPLY